MDRLDEMVEERSLKEKAFHIKDADIGLIGIQMCPSEQALTQIGVHLKWLSIAEYYGQPFVDSTLCLQISGLLEFLVYSEVTLPRYPLLRFCVLPFDEAVSAYAKMSPTSLIQDLNQKPFGDKPYLCLIYRTLQ